MIKTYKDVLDLLMEFGTYVHVGSRLADMELAAIELDRIHESGLLDNKTYATAKIALNHAHEAELKHPLKLKHTEDLSDE